MTSAVRPTVSVIVPTFNRPAFLTRAIASVLAQTWQGFEVIVVDDGSAPSAHDIVRRFASASVRLLSHDRNLGAAVARNTGLRSARGEYVAFLDDDDSWLPDKLSRQLDGFKSASADTALVYCGVATVAHPSGRVVKTFIPEAPALSFVDFLQHTAFGTSIPLISRRCLDEVGFFDESLPGTHDRDLWLRLAQRFRFAFVPQVLAQCVIHGRQITTDLALKVEAKEKMLRKYRDELSQHPAILAHQLVRLAMLEFACGRTAQARRRLAEALCCRAQRGIYLHLILSRLAPPLHRRYIQRAAFRRVDGWSLYY